MKGVIGPPLDPCKLIFTCINLKNGDNKVKSNFRLSSLSTLLINPFAVYSGCVLQICGYAYK